MFIVRTTKELREDARAEATCTLRDCRNLANGAHGGRSNAETRRMTRKESAFGSGPPTVLEPAFAVEDADPEWDFGFPHEVLDLLRELDDWCLAL
jgi:hypothetical protein